jgi:TP901 family phage tail tape measure protein
VSVVANVAINVDSRDAVSKLRQVEQASSNLNQTYQDLNGRLRDTNGRFIKVGDAAQAASSKVDILGNAVKNLASQLVVADLARRFFKGFDEAEKAAAALRTLGVDSKVLESQLLGVSNRLGGLYSQTQLLTAAYDVASSGFANAADNAKILEASAKGATAGLSDINTVGNALTSVLNAYGKSASEAGMLVDGFIQTQNDGKIVLNEYAQQIGKLAPTAAAAGIGIQELNAAVATITAQGVPVESTFAGLNQALVAILKPSKEASDLAEALGIDFNEAGLRAKGFGGLLQEVKEKTGGSTTALVQLFGSVDALKAVLPLVNDDLVKYNQNVEKQANVSGVADKATKELGGTVSAEVSKMINQIGNLTRSLDTVLGPALGGIVKLINVVIAEATRGINVLGQLFSLGKNTTILKSALESGSLRGAAAARVIPGVDELIGQQRRQQLQRQAGAGTGFLGAGFDAQKFAELLKQQPEIKRLLGAGGSPAAGGGTAAGVDPAIQSLLDGLKESGSKSRKKGKSDAEREAERLRKELERSLEVGDQLGTQFARQVVLLDESSELERKRLQIQFDFEDRTKQIGELKNEEQRINLTTLSEEIKRLDILKLQSEELKKQIEEYYKLAGLQADDPLRQGAGAFRTDINLGPVDDATKKTEELKKRFEELIDPVNMAMTGAQGIGSAFSSAFQSIVTGAQSTQQALAGFFKGIGDAFVQMATEIIAQMVIMFAFKQLLGLFGGGSNPSMFSGQGPVTMPAAGVGGGASMFGAGAPSFFAEGGFVTGPTNALIGEGGEAEYVIPASKMRGAMSRYSAGARGNSVIPGSGETATADNGAMTTAPIDVRYTVERINNVDYVTSDQFQRGMEQATKQGAALGKQQVYSELTNKRSLRSRLAV